MIWLNGFNQNKGGYAATIAFFLFMMVVVLSVFQYQLIRRRRWE
jgi:ABC-type sugar transport system permease subunit